MNLFRWFIIRHLRHERLRTIVTVSGVAIGIAVVLAIRLSNASSVRGFEAALESISGQVSLEVISPGTGVEEGRLSELQWLSDFGAVSPIIDGDVMVRAADGGDAAELVRVLGVDILRDRPFRDYRLVHQEASAVARAPRVTTQAFLQLLTDSDAIVVTRAFAERHGLDVGSAVEMLVGDRRVPLVVRGLLGRSGPGQLPNGNFALMDIAAAQLALSRLGAVDRVDIQLDSDWGIDQAEAAISARLPAGLSVQRPARRSAQVETMLAAFHFNLSALSYIALLVGLFLVYNAVTVSVITRRAEIGMLRAIGTPRGRILSLFLGEALMMVLVGCAIGVPLGQGLAQLAVRLTASTVNTFWVAAAATVPELTVTDVGWSLLIGIPLALTGALVPAYEAAKLTPLAAVRGEPDLSIRHRVSRWYVIAPLALFVVAGVFSKQPAVSGLPIFGLGAALAVVFGAALLVPVVLSQLQHLQRWMPRIQGVEIVMARANLGASIRRLSISVAALVVSLAMMVAIAIMIGSFRETVVYWVEQTLQADLFISGARQSPAGSRDGISRDVEQVVVNYPGVVAVDGFRAVDVSYGESTIVVGSGRFGVLLEHGNLLFKSPRNGREAMAAAIGQQAVVVSESFSLRYSVQVDDQISLPTPKGLKLFSVAAIYFDYSNDRGLVVMDEPVFDRYYDNRRPSGLTVYLRDGSDVASVRDGLLSSLAQDSPVFINTNASLRRGVLEVFDSTFAITYALEVIAIFVAMFGVATTLLTLTLERRREIVMLRLAGAERRQLRWMIMAEAGLLGGVSLGIGLIVGMVLSLILIFVINVQSFGWTIQFHFPVLFLVQSSLLILLATVVSGLYPARLAARFTFEDLREE